MIGWWHWVVTGWCWTVSRWSWAASRRPVLSKRVFLSTLHNSVVQSVLWEERTWLYIYDVIHAHRIQNNRISKLLESLLFASLICSTSSWFHHSIPGPSHSQIRSSYHLINAEIFHFGIELGSFFRISKISSKRESGFVPISAISTRFVQKEPSL